LGVKSNPEVFFRQQSNKILHLNVSKEVPASVLIIQTGYPLNKIQL